MKELFISLIVLQAKRRFVTPQTNHLQLWNFTRSTSSCSKHHLALSIRAQEMLPLSEIEGQKVQTHLQ